MPKFFKLGLIALGSLAGLVALAWWVLSSYHSTQSSEPVWSPDGRSLLFSGYGRLYTVNADGTGLRPLAVAPRGGNFFDPPQWSPDGKSIAWVSRYDSGHDELFHVDASIFPLLQVMKSDGSGVSKSVPKIGYYQWKSPQQLIFTTDETGIPRRFYQAESADAQPQALKPLETLYANGNFYPARHFSPDGQRLAIASPQGITVVKLDGSNPVQLVPGKDVILSSWSPNSQRLLYRDHNPAKGGTWMVNADGSGAPQRLPRPVHPDRVTWSPDGRWLLVQEGRGDQPRSLTLWLIDTSGRQPAKKVAAGQSGVWSPDGRQIAFICGSSPEADLRSVCVITANDTELKNWSLKNLGHDTRQVTWSPQGPQLAFVDRTQQGQQLTVIHADGTGMRRLTPNQWWQFCVGSVCWGP